MTDPTNQEQKKPKIYKIRPLSWEGEKPEWILDEAGSTSAFGGDSVGGYSAYTAFGSYSVQYSCYGKPVWGYCFDEYYDEANYECDSIEECLAAAEANWQERLCSALEEIV